MSLSKKHAICVLAALALCVGYGSYRYKTHYSHAGTLAVASDGRPLGERGRDRESLRVRQDSPADTKRMADLRTLKRKWSQLSADASDEEVDALSIESVSLLLCSKEAIQLLEWLRDRKINNTLNSKIEMWLASGSHPEMRMILAELPDKPSPSGLNFREYWSNEAGVGCPKLEIDAFCKSLASERCSQEALFGFNSKLSASEPEEALRSTLAQLEARIDTSSVGACIRLQMDKLPADADFKSLERLLPQVDPNDKMSPINQGRSVLFNKWAQVDPAAAANYVLSDLQRFSPELMEPIAQAVLLKDRWSGIEWIQNFPEGPHFDAAASTAVDYIRLDYQKEAMQLAELISEPTLRERTIKEVEENLR